jgi:predicted O-methyltransferase YrrM
MNEVLREILVSRTVWDGDNRMPLYDDMDEQDCRLITEAILTVKPQITLEVGFACGISTLFVCDAITTNNNTCKHIVIDPSQKSAYNNIGLQNVHRAGYDHLIDFYEAPSELTLPTLLGKATRIQAAIIDGWHTFDHALVDFFYINKMLDPGGIVILDDAHWPSIFRLTQHIRTYPAYEPFEPFELVRAVPKKRSDPLRTKLRRALSHLLPSLKRPWDGREHHPDYRRCVAFRKVTSDTRSWDWHAEF